MKRGRTMHDIFDERWRADAMAGQAEAIAHLASYAMEPLYRFCFYRVGRDEHTCQDVVQETFVRAIGDLSRYDPARSSNSIFPWLTGLARNEIRRALAHRNVPESFELLWQRMDAKLLDIYASLDTQPFGDELLAREETREMVNMTMSQLPPQYSQALEAKYVAQRSVREMAQLWKTTEKAVESLLSRARAAFRAAFVEMAKG